MEKSCRLRTLAPKLVSTGATRSAWPPASVRTELPFLNLLPLCVAGHREPCLTQKSDQRPCPANLLCVRGQLPFLLWALVSLSALPGCCKDFRGEVSWSIDNVSLGLGMGAKGPEKSVRVLKALPSHPLLCFCRIAQAWPLPGQCLTSQEQGKAWMTPLPGSLLHTPPSTHTARQLRLVESRTPTELASPPGAVFAEAPFQDGYDLTIGTSERGSDVASAQLPSFRWVQLRAGAGGGGIEQRTGLVGAEPPYTTAPVVYGG